MTHPYTPRAGSFAERVLMLLKARGPMSETALAHECDISIDVLRSSTSTARRYGAIKRAGAPGSNMWRVASGHEGPDVDDEDDLIPVQRVVPASGQPLPVCAQACRQSDRDLLQSPAGAELAQAVVRAMVADPSTPVEKPEVPGAAPEVAIHVDTVRPPVGDGVSPLLKDEMTPAFAAVGELLRAAADRQFAGDAGGAFSQSPPAAGGSPREVPCITLVTISFQVTPHQAQRICAFARSMTEVRS